MPRSRAKMRRAWHLLNGFWMDDDRRRFCRVAGFTVLGAGLGFGAVGCSNGPGSRVWTINAFKAADIMMNDAVQVTLSADGYQTINVFVCRDAGGLYAMDSLCTHHYCPLQFPITSLDGSQMLGMQCNCHGSTFDFNGLKPTLPATVPLNHYKLTAYPDGTLVVDAGSIVDPTTRTQG